MNLKERTKKFIEEIGLPVSRFGRNVGIHGDSVRRWLKGELHLKPETEQRIDAFLKSLNR